MGLKSNKYRLAVYEEFARLAKNENLKWCVLHGSEGYPFEIGRDLDVICIDRKNILKAIELFYKAAITISDTRWIINPHPIWGRRMVVVSNKYEAAELHILYKINSGLIDCQVDWKNVTDDFFPQDIKATIFKGYWMQLLGKGIKLSRYTENVQCNLPYSLKRIYDKIKKNKAVSIMDKIFAYIQLGRGNIYRMYRNYVYYRTVKNELLSAATVPVVVISSSLQNDIYSILDEAFMKVICGDHLKKEEIVIHQGRQRLVYLTHPREDLSTISVNSYDEIMDAFQTFNENRKAFYNDVFNKRCNLLGL